MQWGEAAVLPVSRAFNAGTPRSAQAPRSAEVLSVNGRRLETTQMKGGAEVVAARERETHTCIACPCETSAAFMQCSPSGLGNACARPRRTKTGRERRGEARCGTNKPWRHDLRPRSSSKGCAKKERSCSCVRGAAELLAGPQLKLLHAPQGVSTTMHRCAIRITNPLSDARATISWRRLAQSDVCSGTSKATLRQLNPGTDRSCQATWLRRDTHAHTCCIAAVAAADSEAPHGARAARLAHATPYPRSHTHD